MEKFLISLLCLLVLLGCNSREAPSALEAATTIKGQIESPLQGWYKTAQPTSTVPGEEAFVGYNEPNHSLDFFRLQNGTVVFEQLIKLTFEGPRGIDEIRALHYVNADTIFLVARNHVVIINEKNKEIFRLNVSTEFGNKVDGLDFSLYHPNVRQEMGVNTWYRNGLLYLPLNYYASDPLTELDALGPDIALISYLNVAEKSFGVLPIRYPTFLQKELYGFASSARFAYSDDKIIYYFAGFPDLYLYDFASERVEHLPCANDLADTPPLGAMEILDHSRNVVHYEHGVVSENEKYFVQAVFIPNTDQPGSQLFLRRTDLTTGHADIIKAPRRTAGSGMMLFNDSLWMPNMASSEDSLSFTVLSF
ncbi:DUF4221 family protein [Neolewinella lacunae]|uniref:DUF4221 family protein n=1 Tax=Neolewinella lacunae TaxID=1517758 RepID=A0A923PKM5_9BACT|nr:DUF4221 family protein [Neolewinella lacunae]MBC6994446.1 DUF4221 family protein [Neolewinella lacunae]MDN3633382.1 DUF4221 family protein [Neolewinella lacunae]